MHLVKNISVLNIKKWSSCNHYQLCYYNTQQRSAGSERVQHHPLISSGALDMLVQRYWAQFSTIFSAWVCVSSCQDHEVSALSNTQEVKVLVGGWWWRQWGLWNRNQNIPQSFTPLLTTLSSVDQWLKPLHLEHTHTHTHTHAHAHTLSHTHTLSLTHTHAHAHARTHARTHAHTHTHTHTGTHTRTHAHTHTRTHTHTQLTNKNLQAGQRQR